MKKNLWIRLALCFVLTGFLFTVSCSCPCPKKPVATPAQPSQEELAASKAAAEKAKMEEMAKQKAIEEEQLRQEEAERDKLAAIEEFINNDINFAFNCSALTSESQFVLKQKAEWLDANPDASVTIEGHCDERGTNEYNLALGDRRAQSAKVFLVELGVGESRLNTISYGEERPIDNGHNEQAWTKNRRAHLIIE